MREDGIHRDRCSHSMEWVGNNVIVRMFGLVTLADILRINGYVISDPRLDYVKYELWDFSEVHTIIDPENIATVMCNYDISTSEWNKYLIFASVIGSTDSKILFDKYNKLMESSTWTVKSFLSLDEARTWCESKSKIL